MLAQVKQKQEKKQQLKKQWQKKKEWQQSNKIIMEIELQNTYLIILLFRLINDTEIAKAQRDFELKKAAYDVEIQTKV